MSLDRLRQVVDDALRLDGRSRRFERSTPLLGSLPELDSMAVVTLIMAIEDHYGFVVEDDDVSAETFETLGSLADFVEAKLAR